MHHRYFASACAAMVLVVLFGLCIAVPAARASTQAASQEAVSQDECNQWVKSHAGRGMQMNMDEGGMRSMFMLDAPTYPTPVVCLVQNDPVPPPRYEGIGTATRKVPGSDEVQNYFNQGLQFYYAFNNRESYRASLYAASLASKDGSKACAMCYVVQALALGPDINMSSENEPDRKAAKQALADAGTALGTDFSRGGITKEERDEINTLIEALKLRFADCPPGLPDCDDCQSADCRCQCWRNKKYQEAIAAKFTKYRNDPDYVILFADAAMNQTPWGYWKPDGAPKNEAIGLSQKALQEALKENPNHNGLVHWYIHLMEMSGKPDYAEPYARTLAGLAPNAGHLVHMPSHIYYRMSDMKSSIAANSAAVTTDQNYFDREKLQHPDGDRYRFGYYPHNIHFELASAVLIGQRKTVEDAAKTLWDSAPSKATGYRADRYRAVYYLTRLNFAAADDIKKFPEPLPGQFSAVAYDYAQVVANMLSGDAQSADRYNQQLQTDAQAYRSHATENPDCDPAKRLPDDISLCVIRIMYSLAGARISTMKDRDPEETLSLVNDAAKTQHALPYDEPPAWLYPVDQTFAGLMLSRYVSKRPPSKSYLELAKQRLEASLQNKQPLPSGVFPENAWAYFGLWQIAEKLGLRDEAEKYKKKYRDLWQGDHDPDYLQM